MSFDGPFTGFCTGIATHPFDPAKAYLLFGSSASPKILFTEDYGDTWSDLSGFDGESIESSNGFPNVKVYSLLVMPFDTNRIWAGTEIGIYESIDNGLSWAYADNGLPPTAIWEMKIVNDEVVVATHGRGIWTVSFPELEGYEPPVAPSRSIVTADDAINEVKGLVNIRSPFDSTIILVYNDSISDPNLTVLSFEENTEPFEIAFTSDYPIPDDTILLLTVEVQNFSAGTKFLAIEQVEAYLINEPVISGNYIDDMESGNLFAVQQFGYSQDGVGSRSIHTIHPYPGPNFSPGDFVGAGTGFLKAVYQHPIVVNEQTTMLQFDEVVLVEPGESTDTVVGDPEFYDFVAIEGSNDNGKTWRIMDGYDSRRELVWLNRYNEDPYLVDSSLILNNEIQLTDHFELGDTLLLRLKLFYDPFVNGWGWAMDNLQFEGDGMITSLDDQTDLQKVKIFPNPANEHVTIELDLPSLEVSDLRVYSMEGKQMFYQKAPFSNGQFILNIETFPSGHYYLALGTNKGIILNQFLKVE